MPGGRVMAPRAAQKIRGFEQGWRYAAAFVRGYSDVPELTEADDPRAWLRAALTAARARSVKYEGCLRYAWPLGPNARARRRVEIAMEAREYPTWDSGQLPLFT
jgi:hypothetical protein